MRWDTTVLLSYLGDQLALSEIRIRESHVPVLVKLGTSKLQLVARFYNLASQSGVIV